MNVNSSVGSMFDSVTEAAGVRAGLILTESNLRQVLASSRPDEPDPWWDWPTTSWVRMRAEEVEQFVVDALYGVGAIPDKLSPDALLAKFVKANLTKIKRPPEENLDYGPFELDPEKLRYPSPKVRIHQYMTWGQSELLSGRVPPGFEPVADQYRLRSLLYNDLIKLGVDWDGALPLDHLFSLKDKGGTISANSKSAPLVDQRFIDYLHAQPADLKRMDWRQLEFLCGEYFRRMGYDVVVTAPSGDGGIDVVARRMDGAEGPDIVLIQAKRLSGKRQVDINVVKALWADVMESEESATRGLITTTTRLAKGAREYTEARNYGLSAAERPHVEQWIAKLTTYPRIAVPQSVPEAVDRSMPGGLLPGVPARSLRRSR